MGLEGQSCNILAKKNLSAFCQGLGDLRETAIRINELIGLAEDISRQRSIRAMS